MLPTSVYQAPINRNANLLMQEAQLKRAEIFSSPRHEQFHEIEKNDFAQEIIPKDFIENSLSEDDNDEIIEEKIDDSKEFLETISIISQQILENENVVLSSHLQDLNIEELAKTVYSNNHYFVVECRKRNLDYSNSFYDFDEDDPVVKIEQKSTFETISEEIQENPSGNFESRFKYIEAINRNNSIEEMISSEENIPSTLSNFRRNCSSRASTLQKSISVEEHARWNRFLKDISQLTIEIDDQTEEFI